MTVHADTTLALREFISDERLDQEGEMAQFGFATRSSVYAAVADADRVRGLCGNKHPTRSALP